MQRVFFAFLAATLLISSPATAATQVVTSTIKQIMLVAQDTSVHLTLDNMGTCKTVPRTDPDDSPLVLPVVMQAMATGRALSFTIVDRVLHRQHPVLLQDH